MAAFLGQVGGGQIGDDPAAGHGQAEAGKGSPDPLAALGDRLVSQAYQDEFLLAGGELDLDIHPPGLDPLKGHSDHPRGHDVSNPVLPRVAPTA